MSIVKTITNITDNETVPLKTLDKINSIIRIYTTALNILHINIRSILKHLPELECLNNALDNNNHIIITSESWLKVFIKNDIEQINTESPSGNIIKFVKEIETLIANIIQLHKNIPLTETITETLIDLSSTTIEDKNLSSLLPIVNTQNTRNTQDSDSVLLDQAVDKDIITSYEQSNKPSLIDKFKMTANRRTKVPSLQPAERPAPSTSSASQHQNRYNHLAPPSSMKPPGNNVSKKQKVRTNSSSIKTVHTNIVECLDSTQDLFDTHLDFSLTFDQFRNFFKSAKGCSDLENVCNKYASSPEDILEIISTIYPNVTVKSAKNHLTRISIALKKIIHDFNAC
ncbi:hypothetical protein QTP88_019791 [Uroleucon formosanum]